MTSHIIHILLHGRKKMPYIIVNLVERSNIKFMHLLQGKQVDEEVDVFYTPAYAAGDVVADSLISNVLLSQSYYKPDIVKVIKALSGMPPSIVSDTADIPIRKRKHRSNHSNISKDTNDNDIQHWNSNNINNLLFDEYLPRPSSSSLSPSVTASSRLSSIAVPNLFIGETFSHLYQSLLLDQGILALGLLRAPDHHIFGNELPFVYSNPVPSLILKATDFIYVLAQPDCVY
ncbi:hypothetical protein BDC45DRAFT_149851 [Circinella umbellata]|nr:hypothetical protein BDC45DRAFT_149851 [Circinella umbellata]